MRLIVPTCAGVPRSANVWRWPTVYSMPHSAFLANVQNVLMNAWSTRWLAPLMLDEASFGLKNVCAQTRFERRTGDHTCVKRRWYATVSQGYIWGLPAAFVATTTPREPRLPMLFIS